MKANNIITALKNGSLTGPVLICAAGILFALFPGMTLGAAAIAAAAVVGIYGFIKLAIFFIAGGFGVFFGAELFSGILLIAASILIAGAPESAAQLSAVFFGAILLINGLARLIKNTAFRMQGYTGVGNITAVLYAVAGILLMISPAASAKTLASAIGILVLFIGLVCAAAAVHRTAYEYPGVIEGRFTEL